MKVRIAAAVAVVALLGVAFVFWFANKPSGEIVLHGINARSIDNTPGTLYVFASFTNNGGPEWLNSVSSKDAVRAELFNPSDFPRVPIPANASPSLAVDGAHVRLFGVEGDLSVGRLVPVTLNFENAGKVRANVRVGSALEIDGLDESGQFGIGRILRLPEGAAVPEVGLRAEKTSAGWKIHLQTENFKFSDPSEGIEDTGVSTGHGHVYVSGLKFVRLYKHTFDIGELPPGKHEIRVILVTDDHRAYTTDSGVVTAAINIEVGS